MIQTMTVRRWGVFFTSASLLILAAVFVSQYVFDMPPCKLCLWQRWPYAASVLAGVSLILAKERGAKPILSLLTLIFLVSAGLALFHFGVENRWWVYASDCSSNAFQSGASPEEILEALKRAPTVRCDEVRPFLFGMTMAFYNMLASLGLAALSAYALSQSISRR